MLGQFVIGRSRIYEIWGVQVAKVTRTVRCHFSGAMQYQKQAWHAWSC